MNLLIVITAWHHSHPSCGFKSSSHGIPCNVTPSSPFMVFHYYQVLKLAIKNSPDLQVFVRFKHASEILSTEISGPWLSAFSPLIATSGVSTSHFCRRTSRAPSALNCWVLPKLTCPSEEGCSSRQIVEGHLVYDMKKWTKNEKWLIQMFICLS